jgi:hypothetical protein
VDPAKFLPCVVAPALLIAFVVRDDKKHIEPKEQSRTFIVRSSGLSVSGYTATAGVVLSTGIIPDLIES